MTIATFPRAFPLAVGERVFAEADLQVYRRQSMGVAGAGRDFVIDRGLPQWRGTWKTRGLSADEHGVWRAWRDSLRGASRYFLGWDPLREYPLAYMPAGWPAGMVRYGGAAWDGIATVTAIGTALEGRDQIDLAALPVGLVLSPGDYVSLGEGAAVSLHRVIDAGPVTADAVGTLAVWVEPEVPGSFTVLAAATLWRASAKFRKISESGLAAQADLGPRPGDYTFTGISTLL